jgi:hypothetical protein
MTANVIFLSASEYLPLVIRHFAVLAVHTTGKDRSNFCRHTVCVHCSTECMSRHSVKEFSYIPEDLYLTMHTVRHLYPES